MITIDIKMTKHENTLKAVVLLSGGLDSFVTAGIASSQDYSITAVTFLYGQKHSIEIESAKAAAAELEIKDHRFITIETGVFRSSLLQSSEIPVPKDRSGSEPGIPSTYVPARNILFLSYALAIAESIGAVEIFIGANAVDYSGYPDCRPSFFEAFSKMAAAGTKTGVEGRPVKISAPVIGLKKSEIINKGISLGLNLSVSHSCYDPIEGLACGRCDSCNIRRNGFIEAGRPDVTRYYRRS